MSIVFDENLDLFCLETANTSYIIGLADHRTFVGHVYYGKRVRGQDLRYLLRTGEAPFVPSENERERCSFYDTFPSEYSGNGVGDYRESSIAVRTQAGQHAVMPTYVSYEITDQKPELPGLPSAFDRENTAQTLILHCRDEVLQLDVDLYYTVFEENDMITRSVRISNQSKEAVYLTKAYSACMDMDDDSYEMLTLHGSWARERQMDRRPLGYGKTSVGSIRGESSHQEHPFMAWMKSSTTQTAGEVYAMHFIYSGNFIAQLEKSQFDSIRAVMGIHPADFSWKLESEEAFYTPEVALTFSAEGLGKMTRNFHDFYRQHLIRSKYRNQKRPILINNWEATYFDFNTQKLLDIAKLASQYGIEMLVMDDGWFGERNDDTSSLGDWTPNSRKLPNGIAGIADKIKESGLKFGIWVEPEMVSVNSRLYDAHPEWVIEIPDVEHSEGRNQRILDLTYEAVQDYIIEKMSEVFSSADISYVKWDMNRIFSDYYSKNLPPERQKEVSHRYVCGLYRCMKELTNRFPDILFEGCAAGGNRFDLGMLCYFPQIWASDNTDALCRAQIQYNYSYGYPLSCISAHVSASPNHQTLRNMPLESRFAVAAFGLLGYECNMCDMNKEELNAVKCQIELYKKLRNVFFTGTFYRTESFEEENAGNASVLNNGKGNRAEWTVVSTDKKKAVGLIMQKHVIPNTQYACYRAKGLDEAKKYHFYNRKLQYDIKEFGELVNMVSPIHIKQGSMLQDILSKLKKMDGETEDYIAYGDTLMYSGVRLKQAFSATGYNENVRFFQDFAARLYFMEEVEDDKQ